jgi:hypothetical protein
MSDKRRMHAVLAFLERQPATGEDRLTLAQAVASGARSTSVLSARSSSCVSRAGLGAFALAWWENADHPVAGLRDLRAPLSLDLSAKVVASGGGVRRGR